MYIFCIYFTILYIRVLFSITYIYISISCHILLLFVPYFTIFNAYYYYITTFYHHFNFFRATNLKIIFTNNDVTLFWNNNDTTDLHCCLLFSSMLNSLSVSSDVKFPVSTVWWTSVLVIIAAYNVMEISECAVMNSAKFKPSLNSHQIELYVQLSS